MAAVWAVAFCSLLTPFSLHTFGELKYEKALSQEPKKAVIQKEMLLWFQQPVWTLSRHIFVWLLLQQTIIPSNSVWAIVLAPSEMMKLSLNE